MCNWSIEEIAIRTNAFPRKGKQQIEIYKKVKEADDMGAWRKGGERRWKRGGEEETWLLLYQSAAVSGENLFGANCNYTKYYLHTFPAKDAISAKETGRVECRREMAICMYISLKKKPTV